MRTIAYNSILIIGGLLARSLVKVQADFAGAGICFNLALYLYAHRRFGLENSDAKEENGKHCEKHIGCIGVNMADMHLAREICE